MKKTITVLALLAAVLFFVVYYHADKDDTYEYNVKMRARAADNAEGFVDVAVVWPEEDSFSPFMEGVRLAADEINSSEDKILGRKIKIHRYYDNDVDQGLKSARNIAGSHDIVAVIGHSGSATSIPASVIYEYNGVLFISCFATNPDLTRHGFSNVFRNIPTDKEFAAKAALELARLGAKKVGVLYVRDMYGSSFASFFAESAEDRDLEVVFQKSYDAGATDFRPLAAEVREHEFNWIMLVDVIPRGAVLVKQLRQMGVKQPILGGDAFDTPQLWKIAEEAAEETYVISTFDPSYPDESMRAFTQAYRQRYFLKPPDLEAAQGYEAIKILAQAMNRGKSTVPLVVGTTLRFTEDYRGIGGSYSFTRNGDITGKKLFLKVVRKGRFEIVHAGVKD